MNRIVQIVALSPLLIGVGCVEQPAIQAGSAEAIAISYTSTKAGVISDNHTLVPDSTVFRFIASVDIGGDTPNEPSLYGEAGSNINPSKGSPYGTYCYATDLSGHQNIWIPCSINPDFSFKERSPIMGQRLTPHNNVNTELSVTYKITVYSPPRATKVVKGGTVIPYRRTEFLMVNKNAYSIVIDRRPGSDNNTTQTSEGYKIYPLPDPFQFVEMRSKLTFAFYQENVNFEITPDVSSGERTAQIEGLGVWGNLQPFTRSIKLIYDDHPDSIDAVAPNHLYDSFPIKEEAPSSDARKLRYSMESIPIFPVDYSNEKLNKSIISRFSITYTDLANPKPEPIEVKLAIKAIPSTDYLISFIVSRTGIMVTATTGSSWVTIPKEPIEIGGSEGTILIGKWDINKGVWEEVEWVESL